MDTRATAGHDRRGESEPRGLSAYVRALREEPLLRGYLLASFVDDVGVAVSVWASQWMLTEVFVDQRTRASFMMPMLACFLAGGLVAGPLADWSGPARRGSLARWRWNVLLSGRAGETAALALVTVLLARAPRPTVGLVLPYFLVSAATKTGLRPSRSAFEVDLLRRERTQVNAAGDIVRDDAGNPLPTKVHLLALTSLTSVFAVVATLLGLVLGGWLLAAAKGHLWKLFAADVVTSVLYLALLRRLRVSPAARERGEGARARGVSVVSRAVGDLREAGRFLLATEQRPLLWMLFGGWLVEVITEFYDGKMIVRHVLGGSEEHVRVSQIAWSLAALIAVGVLPVVVKSLGHIGRIFLVTMMLDGVALAAAGGIAIAGAPAAIVPFAVVLGVDRALTETSGAMMALAQNSASRPELRGRIVAAYGLVVLVSDVVAEGVSTEATEHFGIPRTLAGLGVTQLGLVLLVALLGGRRLWDYGIRT
ncbi:MAG TPA: hypothetical protein VHV30_13620 [Polyangiaceae bacterium]|jgi:hypothetical protein|nr:hypothetical protein [Polyangiaceae bacterium]